MVFCVSRYFLLTVLVINGFVVGSQSGYRKQNAIPKTTMNNDHPCFNVHTDSYMSGDKRVYTVFLIPKGQQDHISKNSYFNEAINSLKWETDAKLSILLEGGELAFIEVEKVEHGYRIFYD